MRAFKTCIWVLGFFLIVPAQAVIAAPYFLISGPTTGCKEIAPDCSQINQTWQVRLNTTGASITAAQTVVNYQSHLLEFVQVSMINSVCSFWAPADPSLGFGSASTPFVTGGNKIVFSCGFSNPGLNTGIDSALFAAFTMKPIQSGQGQFSFTNTQFRYIGNTVNAGYSPPYNIEILGSTVSATPYPTPYPTATPDPSAPPATPTPGPTAGPTAAPTPDTLTADDLNLVDITTGGGSGSTVSNPGSSSNQDVSVIEDDDSIPPPPADMELRPKATPFMYQDATDSGYFNEGEVLSLQSLRELLIPGKSQADKTLVFFNLISTLTFVSLLAVLIWRMIVSTRSNKLKYRHMNELIEGELAVLESKLAGVSGDLEDAEKTEMTLEDLKKELEGQK